MTTALESGPGPTGPRATGAGTAGVRLAVRGVSKSYPGRGGAEMPALRAVDIDVGPGEFVSLLGPSGCGKSTLFSIIAGLERPTTGQVLVAGQDCTGTQGLVGYMQQKDLLLPWRTILDNVVLALEVRGVKRRYARELARPVLEQYGLGEFVDAFPAQLSGGMRQRAALLRTLLFHRPVILLDEPFGALDAQTRERMQSWLLEIQSDFTKTVVFVTHDIDEAIYLADTVYLLSGRPGRVLDRFDVPLARPRHRGMLDDPEFAELRRRARRGLDATLVEHRS